MLPLALALLNLSQSLPHTSSFLETLEATEKPNYINVIKFGGTLHYPELLNVFKQPKIILDATSLDQRASDLNGFSYLNLPRYENKVCTLKSYFNSHFLTIISIDKMSMLPLRFIERFLIFSRHSTVLIISQNENVRSLKKIMSEFYTLRFLNVLHLDVSAFERNPRITSFESFPKFKLVSKVSFTKEDVKNIRQKEVPINFPVYWPFVLVENESEELIGGIQVHFFKNFVRFMNGTLIYKLQWSDRRDPLKSDFDIVRPFFTLKQYKELYPYSPELLSNALAVSEYFIIIPKVKPTEKKLYLVKIFSVEIWISTLLLVLFGSAMFSIYERIIKKKQLTFWRMLGQLFRAALAQTFPYPSTYNCTQVIYFMFILFGYILTTWFNAILGSFVTTTLYDKQAMTFDDMRMQNIKFAHFKHSFNSIENFKDIPKDLFEVVSKEKYLTFLYTPNEYAVGIESHMWSYVVVPMMEFHQNTFYVRSDHVLETSLYRIQRSHISPYKETLDRFIDLVKDVGLFQHWCDTFYIEALKSKSGYYQYHVTETSIQVLQMDFFTYPFCIWAVGLISAFIRFGFEIGPLLIYYSREWFRHL